MEIKEGELLSIDGVIKLELAKKWKIAIYGSENEEIAPEEEIASSNTEAERKDNLVLCLSNNKK